MENLGLENINILPSREQQTIYHTAFTHPLLTALSKNPLHYLTLEQKIVRNIWKRKKSVILTKKDKNCTKMHLTRNTGLCVFFPEG